MPWYLGRPGAIVQLPPPSRGSAAAPSRAGGVHQLLSGARVVDTVATVKRTWTLSWQALTRDQVGVLDGFTYRTYGRGPFVLLDPEQRNLLAANVSSGGDATGDNTGFTSGAHLSNFGPTTVWSSSGSHAMIAGETTSVVAFQDVFIGTDYIPVIPNTPCAFGADLLLDSGAPPHYTEIQWFDATFTQLTGGSGTSYSDGNTITSIGRSVVATTVPSAAVYAQVRVKITSVNSSGSTKSAYTDGWQFEIGGGPSAWVPGLGLPYVVPAPDSGQRARQQTNLNDYSMTLIEV